ncbi:MAG: universal stress protein, partial [Planctomycetota bacterium]
MKRYQRIMVCIENQDRDHRMLGYVGAISRAAETKEVHLVHVKIGQEKLPPELPGQIDTVTVESLKALAQQHLAGSGNEKVICELLSGAPLIELLRYAHDKDIDLTVIGRRAGGGKDTEHEAILARRITRKATCSVLVLPEDAQPKVDKILVPVRNSECSANALEMACRFGECMNANISALNIFEVHSGY